MIFNIGDKKTKLLLSLAKTPLLFYPHYKYHLPLPSVLMIENTNHCNAECVMCPRDTLSRKRGFMDLGLFEKIIKEVSSVRRKPVTHLHGFGEPLLDRLLADRIQLAKSCRIKRTYIVTNASLLFPETSRKIICAGLDKMKISFYGTDEVSYNNTMKRLNYKATFQNIKEFLRIRKEMKRENPRLILQYLPNETHNAKTAEFRSLWGPLIDSNVGDGLNVSSLHNYGGGRVYNRLGKKIVSVCYFPWTSLSVLWDGRVVTCCMDSNGVQVLGDLNSQSVQEVWNGPVLSGVRSGRPLFDRGLSIPPWWAGAKRSRNNIMMSQTLPARINYPRDLDLSGAAAPTPRSQSWRPQVPASSGLHSTQRSPSMTLATTRLFFNRLPINRPIPPSS